MSLLQIDYKHTSKFVSTDEIISFKPRFEEVQNKLLGKTGAGSDFLGWIDLPHNNDTQIIDSIYNDVKNLKDKKIDVFIVIGIGGSYLGARAVIDALNKPFSAFAETNSDKFPHIIYAGHHLCQDYLSELLTFLDTKEYAITVISKSGTTTEPAVAFRLLKTHLYKKYGKEEARQRIIAITDKTRGALKSLADEEAYTSYIIPDDVGGRYSVLTPVGLLPIAMAGFDIKALLKGASEMAQRCINEKDIYKNPAALYAIMRNILYSKAKTVEILATYNPSMNYIIEWWKQLYGESEGKQNKGIFPAGVSFTSDLHSMGQYIQEGLRNIFETTILIEKTHSNLQLPHDDEDKDGLNYLAGKPISHINKMAALGTRLAHVEGGVPNIGITIEKIDEYNLGQLIYFFEIACAYSGYLLGVNPFDQPGVEAYKKNMFALLGKKGFEEDARKLGLL